ncbi:hypothetical protein B5C26_07000 [Photorhabdus luminescens]|uniref:glycosyltransferase n=1 Tax=Photorhabdus luminescens TaxID=29488 RepID=UPI000B4C22E9|nr:glycosyltransferase [Photorhabdus luminescens]OWO83343.1 hypothetical protein B5C26_07000 [Photorhabdus luminescens]
MTKIVNIANIDPSEDAGGLNLMVKNIINVQLEIGVKSSLLYFSNPRSKIDQEIISKKYTNIINFTSQINKETHYIFHSVYNVKYILMMLLITMLGSKYSIHAHGSLSKHCLKKSKLKNTIYRLIIYIMLFFAKKIIFSNESECKNSIVKKDNKIMYIPNLIEDPNHAGFASPKHRKLKKIIYIGKIDYYYKGLKELIESLSIFLMVNKDFQVEIYGFGNKKNIDIHNIDDREKDVFRLIKEIERKKLNNNIKYLGPITGPKKIDILLESGAFILTSNSEAMPLSISEALACSLPVIITKQTNMSLYINNYNAGICCENNIESILMALNSYKDNIIKQHSIYENNARLCFENELSKSKLKKYIYDFLTCIR